MLRWAALFAILAVIAGGLGFFALAGGAAVAAKALCAAFTILLLLLIVLGRPSDRAPAGSPARAEARAAAGGRDRHAERSRGRYQRSTRRRQPIYAGGTGAYG